MKRLLVLAATLCAAAAARAETLPGFEAAEAAYVAAWDALPLAVRQVHFISRESGGFGQYEERPTAVFKPNEPILSYAEPVGYAFRQREDGRFEFGVVIDYQIRSDDGSIALDQKAFSENKQDSNLKNRALSLDLSMNLKGAPPGKYVLTYVVHDRMSDEVASFDQPFEIAE